METAGRLGSAAFPLTNRTSRHQKGKEGESSRPDPSLRQRFAAGEEVRVAVSREQHHLEKQHASGPYPGTSTEPWQDELADHGLDLEKQERS